MRRWLAVALLVGIGVAQAQTTYRWVDEQGKVHYGDRPPVSAAGKVETRKPAPPATMPTASFAARQATANFPVTLHVSDECGQACRQGREFLHKRGVPFTEKSVASQEDLDALVKLTGGKAEVPVLQVGSRTSRGFLDAHWTPLLDAAGYPKAP